ncbi:MAG: complex I subunit 5 family protein [Candidatus Binatia bacterium]
MSALLTIVCPLLVAAGLLPTRLRPFALFLAPWAALPAVGLALWPETASTVELPWVMLGVRFGLDHLTRTFILFTALLWLCSGVYARAYLKEDRNRGRFFIFFLITMSANFAVILSQDLISFYTFFALMGFAAYVLIVHDGSDEAYRAGRIYLTLTVVGEVCIISALFFIAGALNDLQLTQVARHLAAAANRELIMTLLFVGFGIKAGALLLHVWLPLAHPVAPTPASAVLSGAMIKAGLLGWLRFLPLGEIALVGWANLYMAAGLAAAFYGVIIGLTQDNPKTVLAYSSISQMGLMTIGVGVGLAHPEKYEVALTAILVYALHHGLAKGALFLGVGVAKEVRNRVQQGIVIAGLLLPALALAGAPLTSGAVAKLALKAATAEASPFWAHWFDLLLPLAAVGTTVLMCRFLFVVWPSRETKETHGGPGVWVSWGVLLAVVAIVPVIMTEHNIIAMLAKTVSPKMGGPVLIGSVLGGLAWYWRRLLPAWLQPAVPAGDVLVLVQRLQEWGRTLWIRAGVSDVWSTAHQWPGFLRSGVRTVNARDFWLRQEASLSQWASGGLLFLILMGAMFILLLISAHS